MTALHPGRSRIVLEDARELGYERLLLATGAEPRRLPYPAPSWMWSTICARWRTATRCASASRRGGKVAAVGAGWIGAEFAASARQLGAKVTIVESASVPLEHVLGPEVGAVYRD